MTTLADPAPSRPSPPAEPGRAHRAVRFAAAPLAAYLLGHVVYLTAAAAAGTRYFTVAAHERYDSAFYEQIAAHGYRMFACAVDPKSGFQGDAWCGNAGWFPLYPWLIAAARTVPGLSVGRAAVLVGELGTLAATLLFWWVLTRVLPAGGWPRGAALLALVAVFPVGIYLHAVFPMSIAVTATLACLGLAAQRRWAWAGVAGAAAAAAYPVGISAGVAAVAVVAAQGFRQREALPRRALLVGGLSVGGLLLVFAVLRLATGHWDAFFLSQDKYGGRRYDPVSAFITMVSYGQSGPLPAGTARPAPNPLDFAVRWDMWSSLVLVLLAGACLALAALRHRLVPLDIGLGVYAVDYPATIDFPTAAPRSRSTGRTRCCCRCCCCCATCPAGCSPCWRYRRPCWRTTWAPCSTSPRWSDRAHHRQPRRAAARPARTGPARSTATDRASGAASQPKTTAKYPMTSHPVGLTGRCATKGYHSTLYSGV